MSKWSSWSPISNTLTFLQYLCLLWICIHITCAHCQWKQNPATIHWRLLPLEAYKSQRRSRRLYKCQRSCIKVIFGVFFLHKNHIWCFSSLEGIWNGIKITDKRHLICQREILLQLCCSVGILTTSNCFFLITHFFLCWLLYDGWLEVVISTDKPEKGLDRSVVKTQEMQFNK